mgnify:CR=1 FL=1
MESQHAASRGVPYEPALSGICEDASFEHLLLEEIKASDTPVHCIL